MKRSQMTSRPWSRAGLITLAQSSARAAQNSSSSARGSRSRTGLFRSSRTRSPTSVPPGSRKSSASGPSASCNSAAWVVFPERSIPSSVTNTPANLLRALAARRLAARGLRRGLAAPAPAVAARRRPVAGSVGLGGRLGLLRALSLLALGAHLDHRGAVVVQAELPRAAAEPLDRQTRHLAADRAALLEPPQVVAPAGQRAADGTRVGRVRVLPVPTLAAVHALAALQLDDPQAVGRAVLVLAPGLLADLAGAEELVLVHPGPDLLGEVLALFLELGGRRVEHLAADPQDLVLGGPARGDLVHVGLELRGHLRGRHAGDVVVEGLVHRDPRLRRLRRVAEDVAAVIELLDDVRARRLGPQSALLHQLDQATLADARRRLGLLVDHPRFAVDLEALALLQLRDLLVGGAGVGVDGRKARIDHDRAAYEVGL